MADTSEQIQTLLQKLDAKEKKERRNAFFYLGLPLLAGLTLSFWTARQAKELQQLQKEKASVTEQIESGKKTVDVLRQQIESYSSTLKELNHQITAFGGRQLQENAKQITPFIAQIKVRATAEETHRTTADKSPIYNFRLWIEGPPDVMSRIGAVQYEFNHPTFVQKIQRSENITDGFRVEYSGWGCLHSVIVTFALRNQEGKPPSLDFEMCSAIGWS